MLAADHDGLATQEIAQHPTSGERQLELELVDPAHEREIARGNRPRLVVHRGAGVPEQPRGKSRVFCKQLQTQWTTIMTSTFEELE